MIDLKGKRALVFGVASDTSIAWAITEYLIKAGATVMLAYQKKFKSRVYQLTKDYEGIEGMEDCDVANDQDVKRLFKRLDGKFDMLVHAIGFAPGNALMKPIIFTKEEDFNTAMVVSSYSLQRVVRHSMKKLNPGSAVVTLTYLGSISVVPGYRIMGTAKAALESFVRELSPILGEVGHRINAISAGPIRTLAASHVPGFDAILDYMEHTAPLKRNVTQEDVAKTAVFLLSDMASGITGQTIFVDNGFSIIGVPPDIDKLGK